MSPNLVTKIAGESTESQALRQQLSRKLQTLERGLETCQRHRSTAGQRKLSSLRCILVPCWGSQADGVFVGHRTHLQGSDKHASKAPRDEEASENESVMSGDLTLHQRSWAEYDGTPEVGLSRITR